ncbi:MAG: hypothetical protein WC565_05850 [Parcubacteria group bacterium]|jgi:hypothetical protein
MAWKNKMQYEWLAEEHRAEGLSDLCDVVKSLHDRHIRVVVEEEVSECCDRWRCRTALDMRKDWRCRVVLIPGHCAIGPFTFCPECGKRL